MNNLELNMHTKAPKTEGKKVALGAIGLSLTLHGVCFLAVGSYVILEGVVPKTPFLEAEVGQTLEPEVIEMPENEEVAPTPDIPHLESDFAPTAVDNRENFSTPADVIVSTAPSGSSFTLPPALGLPAVNAISNNGDRVTPVKEADQPNSRKVALRTMSSLFGSREQSTDALTGHFYDLKQTADRQPSPMASFKGEVMGNNPQNTRYLQVIADFVNRDWDVKTLENYFKAPKDLSSYMIFIPRMSADEAPKAFAVEKIVEPRRWVVHYKGTFKSPLTGRFRFVGRADDVLMVRFNKKDVFDGSLSQIVKRVKREPMGARMNDTGKMETERSFLLGGDWFNMEQGQDYPIEVLLGEQPGGAFYGFLLIEESGKTYPERPNNKGPVLPVFQMSPTKLPRYEAEKNAPTVDQEWSSN
ncbi:MAG: hypothetical protein SFU85_04655 [Candidatus Methylacidiphilales bacterium]|nr:hypothetical protein [Candidatus Methylacidiphilales bacterium]